MARKKKVPSDPAVTSLFERRDKLLASAKDDEAKEKIHKSVKGAFKCSKEQDKKCLDKLSDNLKKLGGGKRRRSKSRSKSRSRSRSRKH